MQKPSCKHRRASATNRWTWRARIGPGRTIQVGVLKQEKQLKTLPGRTLDWHPNTLPTPTNLTHAWVHVVSCPRALFELQGDLWTRSGGPYRRRARIRPGGRNTHQNMHRTPQNTQRVLGARIYDQYGCTIPISGVDDAILASGNPICKEAKPTKYRAKAHITTNTRRT